MPKLQLRDGETIRAYLEEILRLRTEVHLWKGRDEAGAFKTTLEQVRPKTFNTTTTPPLQAGELLNLSFMLQGRRFVTHTKVIATGVFAIPLNLAQGQRRSEARGPFDRTDRAEVFAVEELSGTITGGRALLGKLLDLSTGGLCMAMEETETLSGPGGSLVRGDAFALVCISHLPFLPPIHVAGTVAHVTPGATGLCVGFQLEGVAEADRLSIERLLTRRAPPSFGQAFPAMRRKTDLADQPGPPSPAPAPARAPKVVKAQPPPPPPAGQRRPPLTTVMRLRMRARRILLLSTHQGRPALAQAFREDGFRQVFEAGTFLEAKRLARAMRFDLLLLDLKVGGHWAKDLLDVLNGEGLLLDAPRILVVDVRNSGTDALADELDAVHIHGRIDSYEHLVPTVYRLLLE